MRNTFLILLTLFASYNIISCNKSDDNADNNPPVTPPDTTSNLLIFTASSKGKLIALNALDGSTKWTFELHPPTNYGQAASPVIANGTVYIGSNDKNIYAIDAFTGKEKWRYATNSANGAFFASPLVANGKVFVGGNDTVFQALDAATGQLIWRKNFTREFQASATYYNGIVYVGCAEGKLYALDGNTGSTQWIYPPDYYNFTTSCPKIKNGVLYALSQGAQWQANTAQQSVLLIMNPSNYQPVGGRNGYYFPYHFVNDASPAIVDSMAYLAGGDSSMYAVNTYYTGSDQKKWKYKTTSAFNSSPAVSDSMVYAASYDGIVHAVDRFTGMEKWKFSTISLVYGLNKIYGSPVYANGVIYVGAGSGFYAIDAKKGTKKWWAQEGLLFDASPCVLTKDGKTIHSGLSGMAD